MQKCRQCRFPRFYSFFRIFACSCQHVQRFDVLWRILFSVQLLSAFIHNSTGSPASISPSAFSGPAASRSPHAGFGARIAKRMRGTADEKGIRHIQE
jgi:hypothetical protein